MRAPPPNPRCRERESEEADVGLNVIPANFGLMFEPLLSNVNEQKLAETAEGCGVGNDCTPVRAKPLLASSEPGGWSELPGGA